MHSFGAVMGKQLPADRITSVEPHNKWNRPVFSIGNCPDMLGSKSTSTSTSRGYQFGERHKYQVVMDPLVLAMSNKQNLNIILLRFYKSQANNSLKHLL